jgi:conjugal transfer pilus assembly protein TraB
MRVTLAAPVRASDPAEGGGKKRETLDSFLPISFTKGQLLGGLDAPTGGQAQSNPHPVLIRLSDNSVLPNRYRAEYRECFVIAAGYGDISSERAYLRTELLSCVRPNGDPLEVKIQGSVFGEDGKVGMRGRLVTKQGQMLANALLAGVVSGIGQGFSQANTTYSTSPLGSVATASGADAYRAGIGSGVGKALDRLAQYYIKLAETDLSDHRSRRRPRDRCRPDQGRAHRGLRRQHGVQRPHLAAWPHGPLRALPEGDHR